MLESKSYYLIVYAYSFILYGSVITGMGPIIPYFSRATGVVQTDYSIIFLMRALGYLSGGTLAKSLVLRYQLHSILVGAQILCGIALIFSSMSLHMVNLNICFFFVSNCCCIMNVICNACIMKLFKERQDFWIQLLHTIFGVGGFIGPFIIITFQQNAFFPIGLLFFTSAPMVYFTKSPESRGSARQSCVTHGITRQAEIITCVLYLLYIGQQVGFGSWLPSYLVMRDASTIQESSLVGSVFWMTNTAFRVVFLFVGGRVAWRLNLLLVGMIGSSLVMLGLTYPEPFLAGYLGAFLIGMFLASIFSLYLAMPGDYGLTLTTSNTANFMMCASMGQGLLTMPIGYEMGWFGPDTLIYLMVLMSITSYILFKQLVGIYQVIQNSPEEMQELTPKQSNEQQSKLRLSHHY